ncbi:MAG: hypothetical protein K6G42_03080 [Lachnospiraceae bacterium]|nr:hypothetical protein [Lachnospiraceae bacterium]
MPQTKRHYSNNQTKKKRKKKKKNARIIFIRKLLLSLGLLLSIVLIFLGIYQIYNALAGGTSSDFTVTTITVGRKGNISETIIEEFNPGFYDEASLRTDIENRVAASEGRISMKDLDFDDGQAWLELEYESDDDVAAFNDEVFYADTIDNLLSQGVSFDSGAIKAGGSHAVIVSEPLDILCPKKILYTGGSVTIDPENPKLAHCTTEEGNIAFVIY